MEETKELRYADVLEDTIRIREERRKSMASRELDHLLTMIEAKRAELEELEEAYQKLLYTPIPSIDEFAKKKEKTMVEARRLRNGKPLGR